MSLGSSSMNRWSAVLLAALATTSCSSGDHPATGAGGAGGGAGHGGAGASETGGAGGGGGSNPSACEPNETEGCACDDGVGIRRCFPDGSRWLGCGCVTAGATLSVSPKGDDAASGSLAHPFKTLARAETAVAAAVAAGLPKKGVVVWIRGGTYAMTDTLTLGAADSGTASAPVTWSGYPGESAHLVGGTSIAPGAFKAVTSASPVWGRLDAAARAKIVVADLGALGITDYGTLVSSGNDCSTGAKSSALELSIDGAAMPLARWPDPTENTDVTPANDASSLQLFGSNVSPDVTGDYQKSGTVDGVSKFSRVGLVGGKQYNLYRDTWMDTNGPHVAWFLTTGASGYPNNTDPWFYVYTSTLEDMTGANGATGKPSFRDPTAIHQGFALVAKDISDTQFQYGGSRPARWAAAPDAWLHGVFQYGWAECHTQVSSIDTATSTITIATAPGYGIADGKPYYAENLLEEITTPGEWYLDRQTGLLYLYPPSKLEGKSIVVSMTSVPLVSIAGASNVVLRDVVLESGRANLVEVTSGSSHVRLDGLTLRNGGASGANIQGTDVGVTYAHIYGTANDGVVVSGGDRPSLTPGDNFVEDSHIHDYARWDWMYKAGVTMTGVGNHVTHNKIHDAPHNGVLFSATNEADVSFNEIYGVCTSTADAGAIYSGRDWGARGDKVDQNYIHDLSSSLTDIFASSIVGIYLDDCLSGVEVKGNIVDRVAGLGFLHGGGRDDDMESNIIAHATQSAFNTDARCVTWAVGGNGNLLSILEANHYQQDPWLTRYPLCAAIPDDLATINANGWGLPQGSVFSRNAGFGNVAWQTASDDQAVPAFKEIKDNVSNAKDVFVDEAHGDMNVPKDSPIRQIPGFVVTDFDKVGIQP